MRPIDERSLRALEGSRPADTLTVWAWLGGELVLPEPLEVIEATATDTATDSRKVAQEINLTIADPTGKLGAWTFDDKLSVAGTQLQLIYRVGGAGSLNYGRFRIIGNEPTEVVDWRKVREDGLDIPDSEDEPGWRWIPIVRAAVKLEAVDLTFNVDEDRFEAPESPPLGGTVLSEFQRLTREHFPTVVDVGVDDVPLNRTLVYDRERLEACQDLLTRINARYRMGGNGECHVYPRLTAPVWRVEPRAGLVKVSRKQDITGLYNRWVVEGKDEATGDPVRGTSSIRSGPLRFGGNHGRKRHFYRSEMITSYEQAQAYAREQRDAFLAELALELRVEIAPRPELQAGDRIEVGCPVDNRVAYFPATITGINRSWTTVPGPTTLTVSVSYSDVIAGLARTEWAQHLTGDKPELTWDRIPGNWGTLPAIDWDDLR